MTRRLKYTGFEHRHKPKAQNGTSNLAEDAKKLWEYRKRNRELLQKKLAWQEWVRSQAALGIPEYVKMVQVDKFRHYRAHYGSKKKPTKVKLTCLMREDDEPGTA